MAQVHVIIGEDEYLVSEAAKRIVGDGIGLETVDSATSSNADLQLRLGVRGIGGVDRLESDTVPDDPLRGFRDEILVFADYDMHLRQCSSPAVFATRFLSGAYILP